MAGPKEHRDMAAKQHMDVRIFITANSTANSCHHADSWSPSYLHHLLGSEALSTGDAATLQSITDWKLQFYKILSTTRDERDLARVPGCSYCKCCAWSLQIKDKKQKRESKNLIPREFGWEDAFSQIWSTAGHSYTENKPSTTRWNLQFQDKILWSEVLLRNVSNFN